MRPSARHRATSRGRRGRPNATKRTRMHRTHNPEDVVCASMADSRNNRRSATCTARTPGEQR
eukprot:3258362-Pyramimonas_sp.AAC.1